MLAWHVRLDGCFWQIRLRLADGCHWLAAILHRRLSALLAFEEVQVLYLHISLAVEGLHGEILLLAVPREEAAANLSVVVALRFNIEGFLD